MPEFRNDKDMARGDIEVKNETNAPIICVMWVDNKSVHLISSYDNGMSFTNVKRRKKGQSNKIAIKCPTIIKTYNENMGGVYRHGRLKVAYEVDRRSKTRFYLQIVFDMFDQLLVNSNILYNSLHVQKMPSPEFRLNVIKALCEESKCRKRLTKVFDAPNKKMRVNSLHLEQVTSHLPLVLENSNRGRCILCKMNKMDRKAGFECTVCNVGLCINKERNCFLSYHQAKE